MKRAYLRGTAIAAALSFATGAYAADEVRIMWYSDGNEGEVVADLLKKFEEQNPDIKVTVYGQELMDAVTADTVDAFLGMLRGENTGKMVVRVGTGS